MWLERLRERLLGNGLLLLVAVLLLLVLAGAGRLAALEAMGAVALLIVAAALMPAPRPPRPSGDEGAAGPSLLAVRSTVDALPEPCIVLDSRAVVLHRNPEARAQFSSVREGHPLSLSMRFPPLLAAVEAVRGGGAAQTVELHQTVPTETWHRVSVAPLAAEDGGRLLIITLHSLTDEKRLDALRTDFIANASHELRTPLASLLGFIDTLLGPASGDAAAREKFLGIMRTQAMRMSKLIDDLLSLSRIEMHQHVRPTRQVDVAGLLREVCEGLQTQARAAEVALNLAVPPEPQPVTGERNELYEVFENLIDNAIKYGAEGGKVDVALSSGEGRLLVSVTDYGAGVDAAHVPRLTERFYRVDAESSRRKKGTGLGLAIVKHIVTRHRGSLSIRSRPGEGTRVEVQLPQ
ncbi:MAG TPA: ATP-binding protein [Devosiaceae bacterium]|jgi:two-component system phosphate regulon sensor histidine kinase PhoR|nr:ATP-binding protein [Devosiaceae bacterium]